MKQIRSQKAMVTGIVALYLSPLASTRKGHRIRDVLKFNSATRIRTWKMLESDEAWVRNVQSGEYRRWMQVNYAGR